MLTIFYKQTLRVINENKTYINAVLNKFISSSSVMTSDSHNKLAPKVLILIHKYSTKTLKRMIREAMKKQTID